MSDEMGLSKSVGKEDRGCLYRLCMVRRIAQEFWKKSWSEEGDGFE